MDMQQAHAHLKELETGMKGLEFIRAATRRKIKSSLALLAVQALQELLGGDAGGAADSFSSLASEIRARQHFRLDTDG